MTQTQTTQATTTAPRFERSTTAAGVEVRTYRRYGRDLGYGVQVAGESKRTFADAAQALAFYRKVVRELRADARKVAK